MTTFSNSRRLNAIDLRITSWMAEHGLTLMRVALGVVFLWFGVLKFFPGMSPAESLAGRTIETLSFGLVSQQAAVLILAVWECAIGLGLLSGRFLRTTLFLLFLQMAGTIAPLFIFPAETWVVFPVAPTLEGQYIIKNAVLIAGAVILGATVRGGQLSARPVDKK
jgi:uncharacterized membrane protein YphA (DoxX/SURF4 family)